MEIEDTRKVDLTKNLKGFIRRAAYCKHYDIWKVYMTYVETNGHFILSLSSRLWKHSISFAPRLRSRCLKAFYIFP